LRVGDHLGVRILELGASQAQPSRKAP